MVWYILWQICRVLPEHWRSVLFLFLEVRRSQRRWCFPEWEGASFPGEKQGRGTPGSRDTTCKGESKESWEIGHWNDVVQKTWVTVWCEMSWRGGARHVCALLTMDSSEAKSFRVRRQWIWRKEHGSLSQPGCRITIAPRLTEFRRWQRTSRREYICFWLGPLDWLTVVFTIIKNQFSPVQSLQLQPHGLQHPRLPCPSPVLGAYSNTCPSSQWCHPTISSLSSPSPPAFNLFQHQGLCKWVSSSYQVGKVLEFQLQHQSF